MLARRDAEAISGYFEESQRCQRAKGPEIYVMNYWDGALDPPVRNLESAGVPA